MAVDALARLMVVCCMTHTPPMGSGQALLSRLLAVMVGCAKVGGWVGVWLWVQVLV